MNENELIPLDEVGGIVKPTLTVEQTRELARRIEEVKGAIIAPSDTVSIQGKPYITRSGVRKYAMAFNISDEIVSKEQDTWLNERTGEIRFAWTVVVRAYATDQKGRTIKECQGVGVCASDERRFAHVRHDTLATAHTRAKNRAIMDLIGGGEVTAEEMQTVDSVATPATPPHPQRSTRQPDSETPDAQQFEKVPETQAELKKYNWHIKQMDGTHYVVQREDKDGKKHEAHEVFAELDEGSLMMACSCKDAQYRGHSCIHCHALNAGLEGLIEIVREG
ncbi:MAG: hypothetical protein ACXQS4_02045 [Methermicoccaceae archaeon]